MSPIELSWTAKKNKCKAKNVDIRGLISRVFPRNMTQYQGAVVVSDSDSIRNDRTYQNYPEILEILELCKIAYNFVKI